MKQKLFIFLGLFILIIALIGLNAASYSQKKTEPDSEISPNRSTHNTGATGTRAFYDLLAETGRKPARWQSPTDELISNSKNKPSTFVIIGNLQKEFTDDEAAKLLQWVSTGGKLVIIDREPPENLVKTTANWNLSFNSNIRRPFFGVDPSDQKQMTTGIKAAKPIQPTVFTKGINGVQTSVFAASVNFERFGDAEPPAVVKPTPYPTFSMEGSDEEEYEPPPEEYEPSKNFPSPTSTPKPGGQGDRFGSERGGNANAPIVTVKTPPPIKSAKVETVALSAPVLHLTADNRNLLVDVPYGSGQIVYLTDPYIVANGGINLVDNAQLAINVVASRDGIIAFDEYHQGYGTNNNRFLQFFAGTPVVAIFMQLALILGLVFLSQSRRFARPVPEPEPNRLSKLEYVSAMAELQQRTKAYDLAVENIYTDFRRRVSRLVGVDNFTTRRQDLALLIVERLPDEKSDEIEALMEKCENIMHGEPTNKKEVLRLTTRLREIEEKLGLQRRKKVKSKR